jgi:hypothetical protein
MLLSDAAKRVIELATAINAYWDAELPKRHPDYPLINEGEDSGPPPSEEAQLRDFLRSLPPEAVYKLYTLVELGRDYFPATKYVQNYKRLVRTTPDVDWLRLLMVDQAATADDLQDGLARLAEHHLDLDNLNRTLTSKP